MLYEKIKKLCEEKGISISALEEAAGLGNATIQGWKSSIPSIKSLLAVSKVLEIDVHILYDIVQQLLQEDGKDE